MKKTLLLLLFAILLSGCSLKVDKIYEEETPSMDKSIESKNDSLSLENSGLTYDELMSYKLEESGVPGYFKTGQEDKVIEWKAKISDYYSQITGIKFCVLDDDHQNVDISKPCDMFWASSEELIDVNDLSINPSWDSNWVKYILNYYSVPFDENTDYYNDIYTVKGIINGIDCAPTDRCSPDIDIISIKK